MVGSYAPSYFGARLGVTMQLFQTPPDRGGVTLINTNPTDIFGVVRKCKLMVNQYNLLL